MKYYVNDNAQPVTYDHEVHKTGCYYLSIANSTTYLGEFNSCHDAVESAKKIYPNSDGCAYCCPACHTS